MSKFLRPSADYVREIDVIGGYFEQAALYLHRSTGKPLAVVEEWLKVQFAKGGRFELIPPTVQITIRDPETGDRRASSTNVARLLKLVAEKKLIISPSMTIYLPPSVKRSLLSEFIDENITKRGKVKKEMLAAKAAGNHTLEQNKSNEQNSLKTRNNGLSGAHSSPFTILFNKSTHSSLTSTCRSATSYGNANNEKLLAGSRHYWAPGIVINNILSITTLTDFEEFGACIEKNNMHIPTVQEVMDVIHYSTKLFWRNGRAMERIREYVETMLPMERAAFVYIGDLYHVTKYNDELMRGIISEFITLVEQPATEEEIKETKDMLDGDTTVVLSLLYSHLVGSRNLYKVNEENPEQYAVIMNGAKRLYTLIDKYLNFFQSILVTRNVPASIAKIPETIRRVSLVSDTDSTMATAMWWSDWYCGEGAIGQEADAVADVVSYLAVQNIAHMMARMSTNIGVDEMHKFRYAMKNEYKFASFSLTNKAKHYFSLITSQEGTLSEDPELEAKGVGLRTSNIPPVIMQGFRKTIKDMSFEVMNGRPIELFPLLRKVADIEESIIQSVRDGDYMYLKTGQVKTKEGYTKPESSNYHYYEMWEEVFAGKYGHVGTPPYDVVKVSVNLDNKTLMRRWIDEMEDRSLAARLSAWLLAKGRTYNQLLLPEALLGNGIPKEILDVVDYRRIIFASVEPYYLVLESLGVYTIDKNRTRLLSDYYGQSVLDSYKEAA